VPLQNSSAPPLLPKLTPEKPLVNARLVPKKCGHLLPQPGAHQHTLASINMEDGGKDGTIKRFPLLASTLDTIASQNPTGTHTLFAFFHAGMAAVFKVDIYAQELAEEAGLLYSPSPPKPYTLNHKLANLFEFPLSP
jgi:hypothetical protein